MKLTESNIPALIRLGRDKEAIQFLYKNVLPAVKKYIRNSRGTHDDAVDIFQDAVLAFYQSVMNGKFDPTYKVFGYVYKLCMFRWINKVQRDKLHFKDELPEIRVETPHQWFSESEEKEEENLLQKLFAPIGEKCLELLNYTIYGDMLMEDIMIRMNFPSETAARMQHKRCKEKLHSELEKRPELLTKLRGL